MAARLLCPWDSPSRNTGVGCHFLLQCMKVKSESEVTQSCPTLHDPMDCSLPGSSVHVHGIFQARVLEWVAIAFSKNRSRNFQNTLYVWHVSHWELLCCTLGVFLYLASYGSVTSVECFLAPLPPLTCHWGPQISWSPQSLMVIPWGCPIWPPPS